MKLQPKKMGKNWWMVGGDEPIGPYPSSAQAIADCSYVVDTEKEARTISKLIRKWSKRDEDKGLLVETIFDQCGVVKYDDVLDILFDVMGLILVTQKQWAGSVSIHRVAARIVEAMEENR